MPITTTLKGLPLLSRKLNRSIGAPDTLPAAALNLPSNMAGGKVRKVSSSPWTPNTARFFGQSAEAQLESERSARWSLCRHCELHRQSRNTLQLTIGISPTQLTLLSAS